MTPAQRLDSYRHARPATPDALWNWFVAYTGVRFARNAVCVGHQAPFDPIVAQCLHRVPMTLTLASRGSGKSFGAGLATHHDSRFMPGHGTRILGGSLDQSRQIYESLKRIVLEGRGYLGHDSDTLLSLTEHLARYHNGSDVKILAASPRSVRGPHIPTLRLDEVDEIDPGLRESAIGMMQGRDGVPGMLAMTSTWHKTSGPMAELVERARAAEFPLYTYCVFEVLERCPDSRSGPGLERCPECPIARYCHEDRANDPGRPPKAKLSGGHYRIDDLITASRATGRRVFEADYLSKGPKADGIWFPRFDRSKHVSASAEYNPALPVYLAIDPGNRTGAVWFQIRERGDIDHHVSVFADYYADNASSAAENARAILRIGESLCHGQRKKAVMDVAGSYKNSAGHVIRHEYENAGLRPVECWRIRSVVDSLALVESFIEDATGTPHLTIHPRCGHLIAAFESFVRGGKAPQWSDQPKDPQHPAEDMIEALRGGLTHLYPNGRAKPFKGVARPVSAINF